MLPVYKKRKFNRFMTAREYADNLVANDRYDVEGWMHIISRADKECTLEDQRHILNAFLDIFPTSARQWKYYIEIEMYHEHYDTALSLFKQCIRNKCYDVELYDVYIALCEKTNQCSTKDDLLKNVNRAYKFVLQQVGDDIKSTSLWRKYLHFLASNASLLNAQHNITDITTEIRKVYQAVIKLPIQDCEHLWLEYIAWEKSLNKPQLAQEWHQKLKPMHELAKRCYLERKRWRRGIVLHIHIVPSENPHAQQRNYQQIQLWKRLIDFELLNKERLNKAALCQRMLFTFGQSLMSMGLFPDIWFIYIEWAARNIGIARTRRIYEECIQRMPSTSCCLLIHFKYFEFLEAHYAAEANQAYLDLLSAHSENTLLYIQYLHFLRRSQSIAEAQKFFIRTISRSPDKHWQLYVAEGQMEEYMNNNRACAQRILENGFKYFKDQPSFVLCYVQFLMNKKDSHSKNELRQIFDTILPQYSPKNADAQRIWKLYIEFEQRSCDDLNTLHAVEEKRNNERQCSRIEKILNAIARFSFLDLLPVSKQYRDTLVDAHTKSERKVSQTLNAMHTFSSSSNKRNLLNARKRIQVRNAAVSRIKIHAKETTEDDHETRIDVTGNLNGNTDLITMPDVAELIAFRPGIRFLKKLRTDEDSDKDVRNDDDDDQKDFVAALPPNVKQLLDKLPPPQQTQLLKLDRNTSMIDVDSFLTFTKLKLAGNKDTW